ncbi:heavy-metal-associated domain-containing protein [Kribbella sp. NBC_00889]|uniref:heavy-metal-associated domain-containing protein n=1 Tax=Kribbella sp. NBC_00889 TaxID=2975974 RepID=UPI00386F4A99|nr:heavy-metal-associated domain-containing protein [Kribbella sp. NBC_00889]
MSTQEFRVLGMSCGHCVNFVTDELKTLPGVVSVVVDLPTETVTITSDQALQPTAIRTAIEAAGYELADARGPREARAC